MIGFCRTRNIPTEGIQIVQRSENDAKGKLVRVTLQVHVPPEFPERYREGVAHAAAACKVKKTLGDPPALDVVTVADAVQLNA